jgi:hypothetical protein
MGQHEFNKILDLCPDPLWYVPPSLMSPWLKLVWREADYLSQSSTENKNMFNHTSILLEVLMATN